jgi:hypothetical protein
MHKLFDIKKEQPGRQRTNIDNFLFPSLRTPDIELKMTMQNPSTSVSSWDDSQFMIDLQGPMDMTYTVRRLF